MFNDDITFCGNTNCPHTKCMRYHTNVPRTHPYSMGMFQRNVDGSCSYRFDTDWETVDVVKKLEESNA